MTARSTTSSHQVHGKSRTQRSPHTTEEYRRAPGVALLRRSLAKIYYGATYPGRSWYQRRLAAAGQSPIAVLVFHRIADDHANPWTTATHNFIYVVQWLKRHYELISLTELQHRIRGGANSHPAVCITFDDGYADNCNVALPLLVRENIPCTYFISADAVLNGKPFAHDVKMGNHHLQPNTVEQLHGWSRAGIEIGSHTRTHADIGQITDPRQLIDEIVTSRVELESALDCKIRYFAFPFGEPEHLSQAAFDLAKQAGFDGVCSAYGGWNYLGDPPFHIRRRCVDGPPNRAKSWSLIDPLRARTLPEFVWKDQEQEFETSRPQTSGASV